MNLLTYTTFCYSLLACGGPEFTTASDSPKALEIQTPEASVETSVDQTLDGSSTLVVDGTADGGVDAGGDVVGDGGVWTLEAGDAKEEIQTCVDGTYECRGQSRLYCDNGSWTNTIDCAEGQTCVVDSRSCVCPDNGVVCGTACLMSGSECPI